MSKVLLVAYSKILISVLFEETCRYLKLSFESDSGVDDVEDRTHSRVWQYMCTVFVSLCDGRTLSLFVCLRIN